MRQPDTIFYRKPPLMLMIGAKSFLFENLYMDRKKAHIVVEPRFAPSIKNNYNNNTYNKSEI